MRRVTSRFELALTAHSRPSSGPFKPHVLAYFVENFDGADFGFLRESAQPIGAGASYALSVAPQGFGHLTTARLSVDKYRRIPIGGARIPVISLMS